MSSNQELLRKADLTLADLTANGGMLQPEDSTAFIRKLIKEPTIIRAARVIEMLAPQRKINKIGFGQRILRKATSGTALPQNAAMTGGLGGRAKPTTEQLTLTTQEVIAEVRLPYDVLEDNIERAQAATNSPPNQGAAGGLKDTIISMIAERAALDMEELCLLGDTAYTNSADSDDAAYLSMFDGWLKMAVTGGNVVDAASATVSKNLFRDGTKAMPSQYLRDRVNMKHFVSVNNETQYRDTLADRGTALGDNMVQGLSPVFAYGSPVNAVPMMPEAKGLFCNPLNLILGIQRQVSLEFDKDISARQYIIVLTARIAVEIEEALATVAYSNIGS